MKGTLFSADFIEDVNGDLRLLEVNTDTSVTNFTYFDYSDFISLLQTNNITKVTVVHKPRFHQEIVDHLKSILDSDAPFITTFTEVKEGPNVIYPTQVNDESDLFVLRMAYDEASIFDSEYAKNKLNLLSLFYEAGESGSVVQFYHSSSLGQYNSITDSNNVSNLTMNPSNLPDAVVKSTLENHQIAKFHKIGSETENETVENRWTNFIDSVKNENVIVQKYHTNPSSFNENRVGSIRVYSIVYGSNLDLVHVGQFKKFSIFDLPTGSIHNDSIYNNELDSKHFFEFATNYLKLEHNQFEGILNTHLVIKSDNTEVEVGNLSVGDELKSFYIEGTSLSENNFYTDNWSISGNTLPTGSYMTSSFVIYKNTKPLEDKTLSKLTVNNNEDSLYVSPVKSFLVHDSSNNLIIWKTAIDIVENIDYLIDYDGSMVQVTSNEIFVTNDSGFSLVELDVEDTDTYIIAGTTPINSFITHNAPCFVAGTKITLADGSIKNIEDVKPGDLVSTFDLKSNTIVNNEVNSVYSKKVNVTVEYTFENGEVLKCTLDHPIYVDGKGWSSYSSELSNLMYSLESEVKNIEIGDSVKLYNGLTKLVDVKVINEDTLVYNLQDIENNHNFFANNVLVHNRFCFIAGTEITLENGETKKIEDIVIGDVVLSFNVQKKEPEFNKVINVNKPTHDDLVEYTFSNGKTLTSTFDHPFFVNGHSLASYSPELTNVRYDSLENVMKINVGDLVNFDSGEIGSIVSIKEMDRVLTQTYIFTVENNNNFYANGVLVHNK